MALIEVTPRGTNALQSEAKVLLTNYLDVISRELERVGGI